MDIPDFGVALGSTSPQEWRNIVEPRIRADIERVKIIKLSFLLKIILRLEMRELLEISTSGLTDQLEM